MTKTSRARYTLEFKQEAVRLVDNGQSIAAAARTLGVVDQTLFNWVKAHKQGKLKGADSKPVSDEQMEISRLRAELARVKMERDILGKATAYFARGSIRSTPSSSATGMPGLFLCNAGYCRSAWRATTRTSCAVPAMHSGSA